MTTRKRLANMEKKNKKESYAAQSPKDFGDESVDDMLANVDQFIQGVYRDLSISPPQRSSLSNTTSSLATTARRSLQDSSSNSSFADNSLTVGSSTIDDTLDEVAAVVSPTTRRNMDAEIERINRICDNVDQNLRSIGLFMNNSSGNNTSNDVLNSNSSPTASSASTSLTTLTLNSPPVASVAPTNRRSRPRRRSSGIETVPAAHVIDLSETQTQTPQFLRQPLQQSNVNNHDDDDDDVILVSANIHPVVDLCTPGGYQEAPRARSSINQRQLNRRRLNHHDDDSIEESCCSGPSPVRRRRTESSKKSQIKNSIDKSSHSDTEQSTSSASSGGGSGHTPFMCPVCMESCLQRQPTSTRCGHVFCKECIEHAIRLTHKCPMCNTKISRSQIFRIYL